MPCQDFPHPPLLPHPGHVLVLLPTLISTVTHTTVNTLYSVHRIHTPPSTTHLSTQLTPRLLLPDYTDLALKPLQTNPILSYPANGISPSLITIGICTSTSRPTSPRHSRHRECLVPPYLAMPVSLSHLRTLDVYYLRRTPQSAIPRSAMC